MKKLKGLTKLRYILYLIIWIPAYAGMTSLTGCGDNPVTNNNGGPPPVSNDSLLFSKDSISIYLPTGGYGAQEVIYNSIIDTFYNIRIEFTASGRGGTNGGDVRYRASAPIDEFCNLGYLVDSTRSNATAFSYDYSFISFMPRGTCQVVFYIGAGSGQNVSACWVKLKNIKIYRSKI